MIPVNRVDDVWVGNMGMGGGFDPNAMAMMYQNMMKSPSYL